MNLPYIINVALILAACVVFYKLLLRRETFYRINRYVLIVCLGISFALPLLQVPQELSLRRTSDQRIVVNGEREVVSGELIAKNEKDAALEKTQEIKDKAQAAGNKEEIANGQQGANDRKVVLGGAKQQQPATSDDQRVTPNTQITPFSFSKALTWAIWIYWFGVIIFGASFLFQVGILIWRAFRNPVIIDGKYRIVEVSGDKAPCSFGNIIFINPEKYEWDVYNQILAHEKIHIRQKHTFDILLAELVLIFQWFNPFAWVYRREIESNLEFLTDDQLVQHSVVDKKSYQLSLVKVSAPHLPLSLTTNYNQSILKTRIAMMNKKRSNLHTGWKYFFLLPVLALLACLLNEPVAYGQNDEKKEKSEKNHKHGIETEGYWFAIIKDDKVNIRFSDEQLDEDGEFRNSFSGTTFKLSELGNLPKGTSGTFNISREAGKMELTGKFDGNTGMGRYKFIADKTYSAYMSKELGEKLDEEDEMSFFFVNVTKDYLQMLRTEGFSKIDKDDIIPMAALKVDAAYIKGIKNAGYKDVNTEHLVSFKALGVDDKYISEIRSAGYKNISEEQIISFKAQNIDKEYITKVRSLREKGDKGEKGEKGDKDNDEDDADDIVNFKAMGIDEAYINSFKGLGITIPNDQLVSYKAVGVTPEYIKSWQALGFKDIDADEFVGMKTQNVTPEYMKSFMDLGYKEVKPENLVSFKAIGVTPEYIKSWHALGFKDIDLDEFTGMKSQNVTPEYMKSFTDMGYKVKPEELVACKALGITPEWIRSFEAAGIKEIDFDELPALKSQNITPQVIKSFEALGFKNLKIDDVVGARATGVTPEYIKEMRSKGFNYDRLSKYITLKTID